MRQRSGGASDPWTQFYYDAQSRLTRVDSPFADGGSTATSYFSYDVWGNRILVTDPMSKATSFTYDTENRLNRVRDAANGLTSYNYDRQGDLTAVTDARNYTTVYDYDDLGRLTMERPPQSDYYWLPPYGWQYEYANTLGSQLTKVRKPDHIDYNQSPPQPTYVDINYTYDKMGRVGLMMGPPGEYGFYGYDINSQLTAGLDPLYAMLVGGTDYLLWWEWGYDADGRMTRELLWTTGSATLHKFAQRSVLYDAAGRRTKQGFHSDNRTGYLNLDTTQSYSYDPDKKWLKTIARDGSSNESTTYTYDSANGRLTRMDYGNGAYTQYTYFGSGAVKKISHLSTTGTLIASVEYDYDLAGNVLSVVLDDSLLYPGDATVNYTYDDLHRLTRETCVASQGSYRVPYDYRYTYDAVGNRTGKTDGSGFGRYETTYSYSPRNELLGEATYHVEEDEQGEENWVYVVGWSYSYDLRGNMVKKGDPDGYWWWAYTWSADDKLLKREFHDDYGSEERTKVEYKYDLLGRRIAKRVTPAYGAPGPWRWYFYDGLQVTAEGTGTNDKMYYTHSPSAIGGIISRDNNGTKLFYHYDRLGNVMAVTDSNGRAYAVYTMEAFGNVSQAGTSTGYYSQYGTDPQPYHLTTKEYDPDAGLYYFNARWYDATSGRFISRCPLASDEEHPYLYADDSPTVVTDRSGLRPRSGHCKCREICRRHFSRCLRMAQQYGDADRFLCRMAEGLCYARSTGICSTVCGRSIGLANHLAFHICLEVCQVAYDAACENDYEGCLRQIPSRKYGNKEKCRGAHMRCLLGCEKTGVADWDYPDLEHL